MPDPGGQPTPPPEGDDATPEIEINQETPDPGTPAPRSPVRRILLASLLAVTVAGIATVAWQVWQITSQKDASVTPPPTVAGLKLDDSPNGRDAADYLQTAMAAEIDLDQTVGAVYSDGTRRFLFFAGTGLLWSPSGNLDRAFALIADDQGAVTALRDVPAGKFAGKMQCGTTRTPDGTMPVCGWADHGTVAIAMFPTSTEPEAAQLTRELRDAAQQRH